MKLSNPLTPISLALDINNRLQQILYESNQTRPPTGARHVFIHDHAVHISSLLNSVILLKETAHFYSSRLAARPMLESLFLLSAAAAEESFATNRMVWELQDQLNRIKEFKKGLGDSVSDKFIDDMEKATQEQRDNLMAAHGISKPKCSNIRQIASKSGLDSWYISDYFFLSLFVHATFTDLKLCGNKFTRGYIIRCSTYIGMNTLNIYRNYLDPFKRIEHKEEQAAFHQGIVVLENSHAYEKLDFE